MKKIGYVLAGIITALIAAKLISVIGNSPEKVLDIVKHWTFDWVKGGMLAAIIGAIIFFYNHRIEDESRMNVIGMFTFAITVPSLLFLFFGYNIWLILIGAIAGVIIGYFTSIIDDHLLDAWEVRHISLPIFFGLGFGGSVIIACVTENWQDEIIYVTDHSVGTEVTVKRYTYHYRNSKNGGSYYSWDHHKTHYFIDRGEVFPNPLPGVDFTLGKGALGKKDRYSFTGHKWVGGKKISKDNEDLGFKWIYLTDNNLPFSKGVIYSIEENYFGQAMKGRSSSLNGRIGDIETKDEPVPTSDDIPGAFGMFWQFFKIMFTNNDFSLLRWIYGLVYIPFLVLMIFVQEIRISFWIFLASSTIIILIILVAIVARSGERLSDLGSSGRRFSGFGGGSFGGGGAGSRW